jgi:hypothetical protein
MLVCYKEKKIATHANYLGHIANSITLNLPISRDLITPKKKKERPYKNQELSRFPEM